MCVCVCLSVCLRVCLSVHVAKRKEADDCSPLLIPCHLALCFSCNRNTCIVEHTTTTTTTTPAQVKDYVKGDNVTLCAPHLEVAFVWGGFNQMPRAELGAFAAAALGEGKHVVGRRATREKQTADERRERGKRERVCVCVCVRHTHTQSPLFLTHARVQSGHERRLWARLWAATWSERRLCHCCVAVWSCSLETWPRQRTSWPRCSVGFVCFRGVVMVWIERGAGGRGSFAHSHLSVHD